MAETGHLKITDGEVIPAGCVGLGDKEQAFIWLEKAFPGNEARLVNLKVDPTFDPLRSDPRFTSLLKKTGLED